MELFGIGIPELILIVFIALIVLGPRDTVKAGRNLGRAVRRFFSSEEWRTMLQATKEIRSIPDKLLEETGLDHPEEFLPSEAEIRKEAGLDDLQQNMAQWKSDLSSMSKGDTPATGSGPEQQPTILPSQQTIRKEAGLDDLERNMAEWKADLSAWGTSPVIIPVPSAPANASSEPAVQTAPEAAPEAQDQPGPAQDQAEAQASSSSSSSSPSPSTEQEQK